MYTWNEFFASVTFGFACFRQLPALFILETLKDRLTTLIRCDHLTLLNGKCQGPWEFNRINTVYWMLTSMCDTRYTICFKTTKVIHPGTMLRLAISRQWRSPRAHIKQIVCALCTCLKAASACLRHCQKRVWRSIEWSQCSYFLTFFYNFSKLQPF